MEFSTDPSAHWLTKQQLSWDVRQQRQGGVTKKLLHFSVDSGGGGIFGNCYADPAGNELMNYIYS